MPLVQQFIGTEAYKEHKQDRFSKKDLEVPLKENQAFLLDEDEVRILYKKEYEKRPGLYYKGQPVFEDILELIRANAYNLTTCPSRFI